MLSPAPTRATAATAFISAFSPGAPRRIPRRRPQWLGRSAPFHPFSSGPFWRMTSLSRSTNTWTTPAADDGSGNGSRGISSQTAPAPLGPAGVARLTFDDSFTRELPADPERRNFVRQVRDAAFSFVLPTHPEQDDQGPMWRQQIQQQQERLLRQQQQQKQQQEKQRKEQQPQAQHDTRGEGQGPEELSVEDIKRFFEAKTAPQLQPSLIAWSSSCAELFDLDPSHPPAGEEEEDVVRVLGGFGKLWPGMVPYAACYAGHQFGNWAGTLGDGRAITLGEYVNARGQRWELQLKGAGKTPYSRHADGRAVLRSSVREFLASEAMFHLGIPTTRALSLVATGAGVIRDMFYTGDLQLESGAVVARTAPSFLRVGSFEHPAQAGNHELLQQIADYAIEYHFPHLKALANDTHATSLNRYGALLAEVVKRNAHTVALWQGVGFVHGVLNTDNTSILGLTIDYGPYGFLDACDRNYTPNTTDLPGRRYRYDAQPSVIGWNLHKFAMAMVPLCGLADAKAAVSSFDTLYDEAYNSLFARKLGLSVLTQDGTQLLQDLFKLMEASKADYTNTWRALSQVGQESTQAQLKAVYGPLIANKQDADEKQWLQWMERYQEIIRADSAMDQFERVKIMNSTNPMYILRNYLAQEAIDLANKGDYTGVRKLYSLLRNPYEEQAGAERYTMDPPPWAARPGVCVNSCSS